MAREVMTRQASDNEYLHKDFHGALSAGIDYVAELYGPEAVREYLRDFATGYYAPLRKDLAQRGLAALKDYFENLYETEGGEAEITCSEDELVVRVEACPAVAHMRANGQPVADMFDETTRTVNEAICEGSPFQAELIDYDPQTGRGVQRFTRRTA